MPISTSAGSPPELSQRSRADSPRSIEEVVGVQRVVVEEQHPRALDPGGEGERVAHPRVAPADVLGVLLVGVLAVVDQEVCVAGEVVARDPLRARRSASAVPSTGSWSGM